MPTPDEVTRFRPMLDFIAEQEGTADQLGGGYNTSLGFGIFIGGEKNLRGDDPAANRCITDADAEES